MQGDTALQYQIIDDMVHVVIPPHKFSKTDQATGTAPGQALWGLGNKLINAVLNTEYIEEEIRVVEEKTPKPEWNARLGYTEADYLEGFPEENRIRCQLQLQRLHAICDEAIGFVSGAQGIEQVENGTNMQACLSTQAKFLPLEQVVKFDKDASITAKKFHLARILNYYDDHFAESDGELGPKVRAMFFCETGFQKRGAAESDISTELPEELADLDDVKHAARLIDAHIAKQLSQPLNDFVTAYASDTKSLSVLEQVKYGIPAVISDTRGQLEGLKLDGIEGALDLILLLDDLRRYATKKDLTEEKRLAARALLCEQAHHIKAFLDDPKKENIVKTQEALTKSAQRPLYRCLTKSRDVGHKAANWALFFPVFGWAVALYNRVKKGSWAFRSEGGSQREAMERAASGMCLSFMNVCQRNRLASVAAHAQAAA